MKRRVVVLGSLWGLGVQAQPVVELLAPNHYQVTYDSEGLRVKGLLWLPARTPAPGVLFNHDGNRGVTPSTQERCLELCQRGFVVFAPSYRGEDGSEGEIEIAQGEVTDVLAAATFLKSRPEVRPGPLGLVGTSHGALISLLAAARAPQQFASVVFGYGVADIYEWYAYLKQTQRLGNDPLTLKTYGQGPQDVPENFRRRHGLAVLDRIQAPVLILQGRRDVIVPPSQAQELHDMLKLRKKPVELQIYPEAGHGFLIYRNKIIQQVGRDSIRYRESLAAFETTVKFLQRTLRYSV
ncbi:S9 family peptidase [Candidatus Cyanaurora vandensis]|uniref:alpha/beta hydrolase family protein n=1 Tax=Candidatus Cyanaurora vandensis TaxID=2714958 RepID=UPI00257D73E7|nr:alpha/beta fold hydrolase [Candidatus Cyanaurora vandensis]